MSFGILAGLAGVAGGRYLYERTRRWTRNNRGHIVAAVGNTLAAKLMAPVKRQQRLPYRTTKRRNTAVSPYRGKDTIMRDARVKRSGFRGMTRRVKKGIWFTGRKITRTRPVWGSQATGVSKFKKTSKKWKSGLPEKYCKKGVFGVSETTGTVADANCCYILAESIEHETAFRYIILSILRRLFEKAGLSVTALDNLPLDPFNSGANLANYVILLSRKNMVTGAVADIAHTIAAGESLWAISNTFMQAFQDYSAGYGRDSTDNALELGYISLLKTHGADSTIEAKLELNELTIEIYGSSQLKVQNRTKSASGSADAEDVNNNPLQGRSYVFNGVPKAKDASWTPSSTASQYGFEWIPAENYIGVRGFGASSNTLGDTFKESPQPGVFWNTSTSAKVRIEPGAIKHFSVASTKTKPLLKLLRQMRFTKVNRTPFVGALDVLNTSMFKCMMVALEDVINVNSLELIGLAYEVERKIGVVCTEKKKRYCRQYFFQNTSTI